jgi:dihydroorotase-like cyclic amidohydrolase
MSVPAAVAKDVVIHAGQLIDGVSKQPRTQMSILITDDRITSLESGFVAPAGVEVIDLSNSTVLPGMIDLHQHIGTGTPVGAREVSLLAKSSVDRVLNMASMGSVGDAYDNAMAESFFATLERELLNRRTFKTQAEAWLAIFEWIEGWYNPHRRHSALGYLSPINYERKLMVTEKRAA